jgi:hypothetical protein
MGVFSGTKTNEPQTTDKRRILVAGKIVLPDFDPHIWEVHFVKAESLM